MGNSAIVGPEISQFSIKLCKQLYDSNKPNQLDITQLAVVFSTVESAPNEGVINVSRYKYWCYVLRRLCNKTYLPVKYFSKKKKPIKYFFELQFTIQITFFF